MVVYESADSFEAQGSYGQMPGEPMIPVEPMAPSYGTDVYLPQEPTAPYIPGEPSSPLYYTR